MDEQAVTESKPLRVAIVGKAPSSIPSAPYGDPSVEIWTLSDLVPNQQVPRWTRHFELHRHDLIRDRCGGHYWKWLCSVSPEEGKPIYLIEPAAEIPAGVLFPFEELQAAFPFGQYMTNTVSWLIAYAIYCGASEIGVYGVDMAQNDEYRAQRPSCEYWLGLAAGRGITVKIPPQSDLLKCRALYGITPDGDFKNKWKARTAELKGRVEQMERQRDDAALQAAYLSGALESQQYYAQWLEQ